jgi:predicted ATPase/Tfp pilus assembly protein PilF
VIAVAQPTGEVTLVFTDIEGSTRLLEELGTQGYREALAEHRRIVREACAHYAGYEVDYEGDAFFYAFPSAHGAVSAVSEAMAGLGEGPIAIRVGIHTGSPEPDPPKYVGLDVHTAARIMSSGHGGQVVVSPSTAKLVDVELIELGEHRLKDIEQAIPLYQLGDGSFPPLKTISNTNLPRPASSFVGREVELAEVVSRVEAGARLVTLSGPGGTGKTRLALEAATTLVPSYKAGVFWVGLASLRDPVLVTETISQVLGAKDGLAEHIADRELLLLLDNLEQVIDAATDLSTLLQACPNLTLLVTSRELLRISGEVEYAVPPLAETEAVSLFCERSQLEASDEIAGLCARLDSLPLAVELAAARTKALTPAQILERLSGRLDLLKGGRDADPRQQTLRGTIEWSYDLLSPAEQELFARLSVFQGGCTLEAAEEVADADLDTLQSLVEKSLLRFSDERYWMLETIRDYAAEQLSRTDFENEIRHRHAALYLALVEDARDEMYELSRGHVVARLEEELANVRDALSWLRFNQRSFDELRLLRALSKFWLARDHLAEGESLLGEALARIPDDGSEMRLRAELALGEIAMRRGNSAAARPTVERWLDWAREKGDAGQIAYALSSLASICMYEADFAKSVPLLEEALKLARPVGDERLISNVAGNLGYALCGVGEYERAASVCRESLDLTPTSADTSVDRANLGLALLGIGDVDGASQEYMQAIELSVESGHFFTLADALVGAAAVALERGTPDVALHVLAAADKLRSELGVTAEPLERELSNRTNHAARSLLGAEEAERRWMEGDLLTVDQVVELAVASID